MRKAGFDRFRFGLLPAFTFRTPNGTIGRSA